MKFEKRGDVTPEESVSSPVTPSPEPEKKPQNKKPVIVYIMIMFIVAFLLMAMSFFMHQRSNNEVLGELQDSFNAMQAVQSTQEKVIALQEELADAQDQIDKLDTELGNARKETETANTVSKALLELYTLQQQYANQDYESCKATMSRMESAKLVELLPTEPVNEATAPSLRYQQLKEAVLAK